MAKTTKDTRRAAQLVLTAIRAAGGGSGTTIKEISDYIKDNHPTSNCTDTNLKKVIDKAVDFGAVRKARNRYTLGSVLDHIVEARRRKKSGGNRRRRRSRSRSKRRSSRRRHHA